MQEVLFILLRLGLKNAAMPDEEYSRLLSVQEWKGLMALQILIRYFK